MKIMTNTSVATNDLRDMSAHLRACRKDAVEIINRKTVPDDIWELWDEHRIHSHFSIQGIPCTEMLRDLELELRAKAPQLKLRFILGDTIPSPQSVAAQAVVEASVQSPYYIAHITAARTEYAMVINAPRIQQGKRRKATYHNIAGYKCLDTTKVHRAVLALRQLKEPVRIQDIAESALDDGRARVSDMLHTQAVDIDKITATKLFSNSSWSFPDGIDRQKRLAMWDIINKDVGNLSDHVLYDEVISIRNSIAEEERRVSLASSTTTVTLVQLHTGEIWAALLDKRLWDRTPNKSVEQKMAKLTANVPQEIEAAGATLSMLEVEEAKSSAVEGVGIVSKRWGDEANIIKLEMTVIVSFQAAKELATTHGIEADFGGYCD